MTLNESIGRYGVRKTLRFEMQPVGATEDALNDLLPGDEDRAAALNTVKTFIEAEHRAMVRRVFKGLPDPLPDATAIQDAFRKDPQFALLMAPGSGAVLKQILERCRYNRWPIPKQLRDLDGWQPLFIKWHWKCIREHALEGEDALPHAWAGRRKKLIEARFPLLCKPPAKRPPTRNFWYDHTPFRMMFDNHSCGMSWLREDFQISRTFLLKDGDRVLVGIVPRRSKFSPYALPNPLPLDQERLLQNPGRDGLQPVRGRAGARPSHLRREVLQLPQEYWLYEETAGETPRFRSVPRALIDAPAHHGLLYLFELVGRGLRNDSNLNALYLRALLSTENFGVGAFHLDKVCEFHVRKPTPISTDGKPEHFRQRFLDTKFFVTLHITCNPQFATIKRPNREHAGLLELIRKKPDVKLITVAPATGGYVVDDVLVPTAQANSGGLSGLLAKRIVEQDAYALFDKGVPEKLREAAKRKLDYVVVRGRAPDADGGVLRGYQLYDRIFTDDLSQTRQAVDELKRRTAQRRAQKEANAAAHAERTQLEQEAAAKRKAEKITEKVERLRQEQEAAARRKAEKAEKLRLEQEAAAQRRAEKEARKAKAAEDQRKANERRALMEKMFDTANPAVFQAPLFQTGTFIFRFAYKTSDNVKHEAACHADNKSDVFQKLRTIGVRPIYVDCDDPDFKDTARQLPGPEIGSKVFDYSYRDSANVQHQGTLRAESRDEAFMKLRRDGIRPASCVEHGHPEPTAPRFEISNEELTKYVRQLQNLSSQMGGSRSCATADGLEPVPPGVLQQPHVPTVKTPAPAETLSITDRLIRLNTLREQGLLTEDEYAAQRAKIISEL